MHSKKTFALFAAAVLSLSSFTPSYASETEQKLSKEAEENTVLILTKDTVKKVQRNLFKRGYDCKGIDGIVGGRTSAQISRYQKDHKMEVTGEIDDELLDEFGIKKEVRKLKETGIGHYSDDTLDITIDRQWYDDTNVYVAHVQMSDYSRFHSVAVSGNAEDVDEDHDAILTVNGDYGTACGYPNIRDGQVVNGGSLSAEACYRTDGLLTYGQSSSGGVGMSAQSGANAGIKDAFQFGPAFLVGEYSSCPEGGDHAQRTAIGTTGVQGDIYLLVSSGRWADGESQGLTYSDCVHILQGYGCTFAAPLDGGGSSIMIFRGETLVGKTRDGLIDYIYVN